jgi:hypothetical protein
MNNILKISIPIIVGVLAISTGTGAVLAKGIQKEIRNPIYAPALNPIPGNSIVLSNCGGFGGMMGWGAGQVLVTQQLADLLGTTPTDLRSQLDSGEILAEIASSKNISQDQLIQTLQEPFNDQLALMLKYGYLDQDQVNNMTAQMKTRLQATITGQMDLDSIFKPGMMQGYRNPAPQRPGPARRPGPTPDFRGWGGMMGRW